MSLQKCFNFKLFQHKKVSQIRKYKNQEKKNHEKKRLKSLKQFSFLCYELDDKKTKHSLNIITVRSVEGEKFRKKHFC